MKQTKPPMLTCTQDGSLSGHYSLTICSLFTHCSLRRVEDELFAFCSAFWKIVPEVNDCMLTMGALTRSPQCVRDRNSVIIRPGPNVNHLYSISSMNPFYITNPKCNQHTVILGFMNQMFGFVSL